LTTVVEKIIAAKQSDIEQECFLMAVKTSAAVAGNVLSNLPLKLR
jgi:hypothetical protein